MDSPTTSPLIKKMYWSMVPIPTDERARMRERLRDAGKHVFRCIRRSRKRDENGPVRVGHHASNGPREATETSASVAR